MSDRPCVFISYSHDSDEHREWVLGLAQRLRQDGFETLLDQYVNGSPPQRWPRWMLDGLDAADFVLVVCTETYYRRFRGHEEPGKGKGVDWEGALITQEIYDARSRILKFVPVLVSPAVEAWIPEPLRGGTHYTLTSASAYRYLCQALHGVAGVEPHAIGPSQKWERRQGIPLTFPDEGAATVPQCPVDISRILEYAPAELIGRAEETRLLHEAWEKVQSGEPGRPHLLTFVALGGEGKTSLVAKWAAELAHRGWPGCDAVFAWSFYSQGTRDQIAVSSDSFLTEALTFFGDAAMAGSAQGAFEKGRRLAQLAGERRALLILDGLEPLQYAPSSPTPGELKDPGLAALLKGLAAHSRGLGIVTTRYALPELRAYWQTTAPRHDLPRLSRAAGVKLLRTIGVRTGSQADFEKLVEDVQGHALTLQILGQFLARAFHGDIRRRDRIRFEKADAKVQGGHAFRTMEAYVKWLEDSGEEARREVAVLSLLGLFDRPATAECVAALRQAPALPGLTEPLVRLAEEDWEFSLTALHDAKLLTVHRAEGSGELLALDAHPLLREYFAKRLREQQPEAWCAAHRRLYEHLCATTPDNPNATLEDLQPLYQAVAHGCQAGLQQKTCKEVYFARLLRGDEAYSTNKLGAFGSDLGAIACFFEVPWNSLSPALTEVYQASLLNEAAFSLRALGRLTEALEPLRAGLAMRIKQNNWQYAAVSATNLSELELTLGQVVQAARDAEQAVAYADRSSDASQSTRNRTTVADALYQVGRRAEAETHFREAERKQAKSLHASPLLSSLGGFRYCTLLLAEAERTAWQMVLKSAIISHALAENSPVPHSSVSTTNPPAGLPVEAHENAFTTQLSSCHAVSERAMQTLQWVTTAKLGLLNIALDHLTLGCAALYAAVPSFDFPAALGIALSEKVPPSAACSLNSVPASHLESAVSGLRRAGTQHHLPRGLLARAWLRFLTGSCLGFESAQADLDEAWEIAERGSMPLFLADIHLYRARLFFRETPYPWRQHPDGTPRGPADDLAAAEKLIKQCGYHRRDEELADAQRAILGTSS